MSMTFRGRMFAAMAAGALWAAAAAGEGTDLSKWPHMAPVELKAAPGRGAIEAPLTPDVFAKAQPSLADLRLTGEHGRIVPYVLRIDSGWAQQPVPLDPVRTYNPVFLPGKSSTVTADFGRPTPKTHLTVETPGANFRRRVTVEAGPDGQNWQVLCKTAWLFCIGEGSGQYRKDRIDLPDNDLRYLRVTVFNAPDDPERIEIRRVRAWHAKATPPAAAPVDVLSSAVTQVPQKKCTEIALDLGYENLPLYGLTPAAEDTNFLRRVEVLGRNSKTRTVTTPREDAAPRKREVPEEWHAIADGTIYRFSGEGDVAEDLTVRLRGEEARCRYLLLRIHNGDDAPLHLGGVKVTRLQYYVAWQAAGTGPVKLYFGNPQAQRPVYDLVHFIDALRKSGVATASLGPTVANPRSATKRRVIPWSERHQIILWAALGVVIVVLGVLVIRQARRASAAKAAQPSDASDRSDPPAASP